MALDPCNAAPTHCMTCVLDLDLHSKSGAPSFAASSSSVHAAPPLTPENMNKIQNAITVYYIHMHMHVHGALAMHAQLDAYNYTIDCCVSNKERRRYRSRSGRSGGSRRGSNVRRVRSGRMRLSVSRRRYVNVLSDAHNPFHMPLLLEI